jgi:glutamine cyclotransferase
MKTKSLLTFLILFSFLVSCNSDYKFKLLGPKKIKVSETLKLELKEVNDFPIDSVQFSLNGIQIPGSGNNTSLDISKYRLGKQLLSAQVFFGGQTKKLNQEIYFLAPQSPKIHKFEIVNTYPHDAKAFTQGLFFKDGYLYESTGQYGLSSVRKVELETGKVLQKVSIDEKYFGEGMTYWDNKLYVLTWRAEKGLIFDFETFDLEGSFPYGQSKQGWGLTNNETELIKSDGTERIYFLDPKNQQEKYFIEAYTDSRKAERLNELEFINGEIFANIWNKNTIIIIDPDNGAITGMIDLGSLQKKIKSNGDADQVLNGIAYDSDTNHLFVTGKNWDKLFEIRILD